MLWGENRGKVKGPAAARSQTHDTSGLSHQCSATEPWHLDDHQPSQSSISTAQVVFLTNLRPFSDPWKGNRDRWVWLCMLGSLAIYLIITQCFHSQMFLWRNWFPSIDRLLHVWHQGGLKFLVLLQLSVALSSQIADVFSPCESRRMSFPNWCTVFSTISCQTSTIPLLALLHITLWLFFAVVTLQTLQNSWNFTTIKIFMCGKCQIQGTSMYETICTQNWIALLIWQYKH